MIWCFIQIRLHKLSVCYIARNRQQEALVSIWIQIKQSFKQDRAISTLNNKLLKLLAMSVLLYGYATWTLMKCLDKKLNGNYIRMLCAVLNKSWKQHFTKQQLCDHLPPISQTIQVKWTKYTGNYWGSWEKLISKILQWAPTHVGW